MSYTEVRFGWNREGQVVRCEVCGAFIDVAYRNRHSKSHTRWPLWEASND